VSAVETRVWRRSHEILLAALNLDPEARDHFVATACAGDSRLRREVESLLNPDPEALRRAERPVFEWLEREGSELKRIGPYQIVRELGRGGLSVVYLGRRDDGQDRRPVALKLLKRGMDTEDLLRRFRREGEILARLRHPNIAELVAGGTTEDGRPYLVMEYVDGEPIDRYCDARRLPLRARLELLLKVCSAVEHAHRRLVVHRDLKATNLLVTAGGEPKLLDFGISKLLEPETHLPQSVTLAGLRVLTPESASPEQVRGEPVTTASDVYSLGVVLYELLCGQPPYRFESRQESEIRRVICHQEPPRPSVAVRQRQPPASPDGPGGELSAELTSRARGTDPRRLARRLKGDLDNIALQALRKEPERRYTSVEQLAEELRRHLEGRPIRARPNSLSYRLGKLLARRRREAGAAALLLLLLGGFLVDRELQQRRVVRERDKAERLKEFLVELFEESDPEEARGRRLTVREVLDRSAVTMRALRDQPELQAAFMDTIGVVYLNLGLYQEAEPLLEEALALHRRLHGGSRPEVAESLAHLGALRAARSNLAAAEPLLREALAMRRRLLGGGHAQVAESLGDLAQLFQQQGDYEAAEPLLQEALTLLRRLHGRHHPDVATAFEELAALHTRRGRYAEAEPLFRQALAMRRELLGDDHPDVARSLNNLGSMLSDRGDGAAAEPLLLEALTLRRRLLGEAHPEVATTLANLGHVAWGRRDLAAAERFMREALAIERANLGEDHASAAVTQGNLAVILQEKGDLETAEALLRQSLAVFRHALGEDHPAVAIAEGNLGAVLSRQGRAAEAEESLRQALALKGASLGEDHPQVAFTATDLARLRLGQGEVAEAERLARQALAILRDKLPSGNPRTAQAAAVLGGCLSRRDEPHEAEALLRESYEVLRREQGADASSTRDARRLLVEHLERQGMAAEAARYREDSPEG
jgi:serine/threonine-protein kinase